MSNHHRQTILDAIKASSNMSPGYVERCLHQHSPGHSESRGSTFLKTVTLDDLLEKVNNSDLLEFIPEGGAYTPKESGIPCRYFKTPISGILGIVETDLLKMIFPNAQVSLEDPKGVIDTPGGGVKATAHIDGYAGAPTDFTTIIIGVERAGEPAQIFSIHPGEPIPNYAPIKDKSLLGKTVSLQEAHDLGFTYVNIAK